MTMPECYIVAAGDFSEGALPIAQHDLVIAADGGYSHLQAIGARVDLVVGDFDSSPEPTGVKVIRLPVEKDDTDMLAAIRLGLMRGYSRFRLYGGLGGMLSHTLANVQCLAFLREHGARGWLYGADVALTLLQEETLTLSCTAGEPLSVFAFDEKAEGVTLTGLQYTLEDATIGNGFPIGVSNAFADAVATISVRCGRLLVLCPRTATVIEEK
jgi:thiamine pyrophosphokinase